MIFFFIRIPNELFIDKIIPQMIGYTTKITVQEKMNVGVGQTSPTRYQKFIFIDVKVCVFNN